MEANYDTLPSKAGNEWDNFRVFRIFFFPALGGLLFGYDIGATSYVSGQLMDKDASGTTWHNVVSGNSLLQGAITSSGVGGALIGSLLVFKVTEALGTRREMLVASVLFAVGAFIEAMSSTASFSATVGIGLLLLGRWTYGVGCGFAMHGAPSYIGELSPPAIRGALVSLKEGMVVLGILLGYVLGFALSTVPGGWRYTYGASMVPSFFMFFGVASLPSPPRWLLSKGEHAAAREAASFVFPSNPLEGDRVLADAAASVRDKELAAARRGSSGPPPLFTAKNRRALVAGLGVVTLQQVTGQPSVLYYATSIFDEAGISSYAAVLTGAFKLVATLGSVVVVDNYGRRWLLMVGISLMLVALTVMCIAFYGYQTEDDDEDDDGSGGFTPRTATIVGGMFLYIGGYQVSYGPIAWLLISEIFATDVRDSAIAVAVQCNFAWNLIVSFSYPSIVSGLGTVLGQDYKFTAAFGIFDALTLYALWFVYSNVPETKGLSLEEIEKLLASPRSSPSIAGGTSPLLLGGGGNPSTDKGARGGAGAATSARPSHSIAHSLNNARDPSSSTTTSANTIFNYPLLGEGGVGESGGVSSAGTSNRPAPSAPYAYDADVNSF